MDGERRHAVPGAGGADREILHRGGVGDVFVEAGAALDREIGDGADVETQEVHQLQAAEALADVFQRPVGVGAAAVGGGDRHQRGDAVVHAELVDHVPRVEAAHRVGDNDGSLFRVAAL